MTQPKIEGVGHGKPVMPFGSDGTDWYALLIDALGHLQVDVVSAALGSGGATEATLLLIKGYVDALETLLAGGLPAALDSGALKIKEQSPLTGFATSANQTTMITALQLIDDLRAALGSVNTDDLQVDVKTYPGSNAFGNVPFGYESIVHEVINSTIVGANGYIASFPCSSGYIEVITNVIAWNDGHTSTCVYFVLNYDGADCEFYSILAAIAASQRVPWSGHIYLNSGDSIRAYFTGSSNGDTARIRISGYRVKIA